MYNNQRKRKFTVHFEHYWTDMKQNLFLFECGKFALNILGF